MRYLRLCLVTVALVLALTASAAAQHLYEWESPPGSVSSPALAGPDGVAFAPAALPVRLDLDLVARGAPWLGFPMPEGGTMIATQTRFEQREGGGFLWGGGTLGNQVDSVLLVGDENGVFGTFGEYDEQRYEIWGSRSAAHIRPILGKPMPEWRYAHGLNGPPLVPESGSAAEPRHTPIAAEAAETTHVIDVLVLLSNKGKRYWGYWYNDYTTRQLIDYATAHVNTVFSNGKIPARVRLTGWDYLPADIEPGPGTYQGHGDDWPDELTASREVAELRAAADADIVLAFVHDPNASCGHSWTWVKHGGEIKPHWFAPWAHAMVNLYCDNKGWGNWWDSSVHEIGHLHGALHNPEDSIKAEGHGHLALFDYGYGHRDGTNMKRSMMSYGSRYTRVPYYSTTRVSPNGWTLGLAGQSENERVMKAMAGHVAAFSEYPPAPSDLTAVSPGKGTVELRWTDNAHNETGFRAYYRRLGGDRPWKEYRFDMGWPNLESTWVQGLKRNKQYRFYVRAFNGDLQSTMSNKVTVRVK
jgi:hypothetical protein